MEQIMTPVFDMQSGNENHASSPFSLFQVQIFDADLNRAS